MDLYVIKTKKHTCKGRLFEIGENWNTVVEGGKTTSNIFHNISQL